MTNTPEDPSSSLYSHHIFIFPFKWSPSETGLTFVEQTNLSAIDQFFSEDSVSWLDTPYTIDTLIRYNEYNYFYDYVREILYDTYKKESPSPLHSAESGTEQLLRHYQYNIAPGEASYKIWISKPKEGVESDYTLEVDSILLQIYNTGIGILSFHLNNRLGNQKSPEDILKINQFGRRIYPPFFFIPKEKVGTSALDKYSKFKGNVPRGAEIAHQIELVFPKDKIDAAEKWESYESYETFESNPFILPKFITRILPPKFVKSKGDSEGFNIIPALDDRMFVVCWYGNKQLANQMYKYSKIKRNKKGRFKRPAQLKYLQDDWWYKYVFVDANDKTCQNEVLQEQLIGSATNGRWAGYGTLYGISDYSFVMLTAEIPSMGNAAFQITHLQTIYYKLAELVLLQRASVQRFSDEVTHISRLETDDEELPEKVSSLYRQYIRFVNKIYFREVTAQTQGVELYQLLQSQARLEKQVKDLDDEIHELHNYVLQTTEQDRLKEEKKLVKAEGERNVRLENLTVLGAVFLPPSLLLAFYGVSIMGEIHPPCLQWVLLGLFVLIILISFLSYKSYKSDSQTWKWTLGFTLLFALSSPAWLLSILNCQGATSVSDDQLPKIEQQLENINRQIETMKFPIPVIVDTLKSEINVK